MSPELKQLKEHITLYGRETRWLEFKRAYVGDDIAETLGKYISALSNAACLEHVDFGYLYYGVDDQTMELVGTDFDPARIKVSSSSAGGRKDKKSGQALELYLRCYISPHIPFEIVPFKDELGKFFVVFRIPAAQGEPTCFKNKAWVRVDSHTTELSQYTDWVRDIYNSQKDWSASVVDEAALEDLDPKAIEVAKRGYAERMPAFAEAMKAWDLATFLDKARLTIRGKITRTALLLLGKPEAAHLLEHPAQLVWSLRSEGELASEIFTLPFLLSTTELLNKIRNYRIKVFPQNSLLPIEVYRYDAESILEALHNCIAHQDYTRRERILVRETPDQLIFENAGRFFAGSPDHYIEGKETPRSYRNRFLANAMVALRMIDTQGYGIHKLFERQRKSYLPMPHYEDAEAGRTILHLPGNVIDPGYSLLLYQRADIDLMTAVWLDRIQRNLEIPDDIIKSLRKQKLIEGRKPHLFISKQVAQQMRQRVQYSRMKGLNDKYYVELVLEALRQHKVLMGSELRDLLLPKLPDSLDEEQKEYKVANLLQKLKREGKIRPNGRKFWELVVS